MGSRFATFPQVTNRGCEQSENMRLMTDSRALPSGLCSFRRRRSLIGGGRSRAAVTLLEMMVVVALAGIVLAAALPRVNLGRYKVDAAMRIVQGTLQQAQRNAIQRQHDVIVGFDTAASLIRVLYDANNNRGADPGEHIVRIPLQEGNRFAAPGTGLGGTATAAVAGPNLTEIAGLPSVIFRRDGATSSEVAVYVRAPGSAQDYRALAITQSTGRAQLFRYTAGVWRKDGG